MPFIAGPETVPSASRLILFWPRTRPPRAPELTVTDQNGEPLPFTSARVSLAPAYEAYELRIDAGRARSFKVESSTTFWQAVSSTFTVDAGWRPASAGPAEQGFDVAYSTYAWPCSFERTRTVSFPSSAPAYRVEWRPKGATAWSVLVAPAHFSWFHDRRRPSAQRSALRLGHLNCMGWNFRWDHPVIEVRVTPLFPDRGEGEPMGPWTLEAPPRIGDWYRHDVPGPIGLPE